MYERTAESRHAEYIRRKQRGGARKQWVKKAYGLDWEQYQQMLEAQNNLCAICKKPETARSKKTAVDLRPLAVDHNHY